MRVAGDHQVLVGLHHAHGIRCHVVAELWSFENIKGFVLENVGLAIVPRITVMEELRTGSLVEIGLPELNFHRGTVMCFRRDCISEAAGRLIEIMRSKYHRSIINSSNQGTLASPASAVYKMDARSA